MAQTPPIIQDGILTYQWNEKLAQVVVDSSDWYAWLEAASTFTFRSEHGSFTARKERAGNRRGRPYWRAYCTRNGKLRRAYLGQSEELTLHRLESVAAQLSWAHIGETALAGQALDEDAVPRPRRGTNPSFQKPAEPKETSHEEDTLKPRRSTLPLLLTSFLGRELEVAAVATLLQHPEMRLLTLTGPAGVGKTRLALQVATDLLESYPDGVYFVSLAPLRDSDLVLPTMAQTLSLREVGDQSSLALLQASLHDKQLLLVLDNFEHVVTAAPLLVKLLEACPALKLLVTSREVLHLRAEHQFPVPPLAFPKLEHLPESDALEQYAAVDLFLQRAQAVRPDFALTTANAPAVAGICAQLDGLPLAIELAAARIKLLSPQQLLRRLEHRLEVLTGGAQDLPARQQTLRNTLQWSYDLLSPGEQWLFRLLSVFVGGCILETVEVMCRALGDGVTSVLDGVQRLLDNNLVSESKQPDSEVRLMMLETIREYGQERLAASGEMEVVKQAHAEYYLALAEAAEPKLKSAEQLQWLERLEQEYDNLRAALNYLLKREQFELALRMASALGYFYLLRAHVKEGQHWIERALAGGSEAASSIRARGLYWAGAMMYFQGHWERAAVLSEESLKLSRTVGDKLAIAYNLSGQAHIAFVKEDSTAVCALCEESLPLFREVGDRWGMAEALVLSAYGYDAQGDYVRARALCEEGLALDRELGDRFGTAYALQALGYFAYKQGDYASARVFYEESLTASRAIREIWISASSLAGLGEVAAAQEQFRWAARLWGAMENLCQPLGTSLLPIDQAAYESATAATRTQLGEEAFTTLWAEGWTMSLEHVLADREPMPVQKPTPTAPPLTEVAPPPLHAGLTSREMDVLRLITQGLTSAQIAERLVIGVVTVNFHVRSIYSKLGVSSRSAATRYAIEHHLV